MPTVTNFAIPGLQELQSPVSDVTPKRWALPRHSKSTTVWPGVALVGPFTNNGAPMSSPMAYAEMAFSRRTLRPDEEPSLVLTTTASEITISDAAAWTFVVIPQPLNLNLGEWYWTMHARDAAGNTVKLHDGSLFIDP